MDEQNGWLMPMAPEQMLQHEAQTEVEDEAPEDSIISQALAVIQQQSDLIGQLTQRLKASGN